MSISKGATVLVAGATGAVGPCVVQALCKAGHTVRTKESGSNHKLEHNCCILLLDMAKEGHAKTFTS